MKVLRQSDKETRFALTVDPGSPTPIYAQLCAQIRAAIGSRILVPGQRLPTMRAVALDSRVDLNTVQKAYRELERDGFLVTQGARGTFVADAPPAANPLLQEERALALAHETIAATLIQGLDPLDVAQAIIAISTQNKERPHG